MIRHPVISPAFQLSIASTGPGFSVLIQVSISTSVIGDKK
jgi:hypothetical protein